MVGFDNTLIAQVMNISSVAQPIREIGRLGFQEMMRLTGQNEMDTDTHHLILSPRLVLRNSSVRVVKSIIIRRQYQGRSGGSPLYIRTCTL